MPKQIENKQPNPNAKPVYKYKTRGTMFLCGLFFVIFGVACAIFFGSFLTGTLPPSSLGKYAELNSPSGYFLLTAMGVLFAILGSWVISICLRVNSRTEVVRMDADGIWLWKNAGKVKDARYLIPWRDVKTLRCDIVPITLEKEGILVGLSDKHGGVYAPHRTFNEATGCEEICIVTENTPKYATERLRIREFVENLPDAKHVRIIGEEW